MWGIIITKNSKSKSNKDLDLNGLVVVALDVTQWCHCILFLEFIIILSSYLYLFSFLFLEFLLLKKWSNFSFYDAVFIQEAKQALELMGKWEMIDVSDALELLSPVFESEEVIFKRDLWENCYQYGCMSCVYIN